MLDTLYFLWHCNATRKLSWQGKILTDYPVGRAFAHCQNNPELYPIRVKQHYCCWTVWYSIGSTQQLSTNTEGSLIIFQPMEVNIRNSTFEVFVVGPLARRFHRLHRPCKSSVHPCRMYHWQHVHHSSKLRLFVLHHDVVTSTCYSPIAQQCTWNPQLA